MLVTWVRFPVCAFREGNIHARVLGGHVEESLGSFSLVRLTMPKGHAGVMKSKVIHLARIELATFSVLS